MKLFSNIEINDAAITVLRTFSATIPDDRSQKGFLNGTCRTSDKNSAADTQAIANA
jgi:hypothetical protein